MRPVGFFCMFVLSGVHLVLVSGSFADFFQDFPRKISNAWTYTWDNIVEGIKKPVKVKRLGRLGRLKTTAAPSTFMPLSSENQMDDQYERIKFNLKNQEPIVPDKKFEYKLLPTTKATTERMKDVLEKEIIEMQHLLSPLRSSSLSKLTIPHLRPPKWSSLEDWRKLQKPIYVNSNEDEGEGRERKAATNPDLTDADITRPDSSASQTKQLDCEELSLYRNEIQEQINKLQHDQEQRLVDLADSVEDIELHILDVNKKSEKGLRNITSSYEQMLHKFKILYSKHEKAMSRIKTLEDKIEEMIRLIRVPPIVNKIAPIPNYKNVTNMTTTTL